MARLDVPLSKFPNLKGFFSGERITVSFTGTVEGYKDSILHLSVDGIDIDKSTSRRNPGDLMKQMNKLVEYQGMQAIHRP